MSVNNIEKKPRSGNTGCCVVLCHYTYGKTDSNIKFYSFPSKPHLLEGRQKWIKAVNRINSDGTPWQPTSNSRICSYHFIGGNKSEDPRHPAYCPTIFTAEYKRKDPSNVNLDRFNRWKKRTSVSKPPFLVRNQQEQKESPSDIQLHQAAMKGDLESLKKILDSGKVHIDSRDKEGTTPLILASANGQLECVKELLEQGADPAACRVTGTTALFFAAQCGFFEIVQILLDNNAPVDSSSVDGGSPLFVACQCGHMDIVKELVARGAKINTHMKDKATPLFIAAQNGHYKILVYLLAQGFEADSRRTDGATPLWIAAQMGHDHIVAQLLKAGARVDAARHDGATPLFKASHKGHSAVVGELLKYRPSLGLLPNGESALHAAALVGCLPVCKQLIAAGADPSLKNAEDSTPADLAFANRHNTVAEYLKGSAKRNK